QYRAGAAHDLQLLDRAPSGVLQVRHQVPLVVELMEGGHIGGVGHLDVELDVAARQCRVDAGHHGRAYGRERRGQRTERRRIVEVDRAANVVFDLRAVRHAIARLVGRLPEYADVPAPAAVVAVDPRRRFQPGGRADKRRRHRGGYLPGRNAGADALRKSGGVIDVIGELG